MLDSWLNVSCLLYVDLFTFKMIVCTTRQHPPYQIVDDKTKFLRAFKLMQHFEWFTTFVECDLFLNTVYTDCLSTSPAATYEAEVIKVGVAMLHGGCGIA